MSARRRAIRRAVALENKGADALASVRTARVGSRRREPDIAAIKVANVALIAECKSRKKLPKMLVDALKQAKGYAPGAEPLAVLREVGGRALVALDLMVFCRLVGLAPEALPTRHTPTPKNPKQTELVFG